MDRSSFQYGSLAQRLFLQQRSLPASLNDQVICLLNIMEVVNDR